MQKSKTTLSQYIQDLTSNYRNMTIQTFHFNPIMVNTFLLYDESGEAVIIDPGNCNLLENKQLEDYIHNHNLTVKYIINTHPHIDHILGNQWCVKTYGAPLLCHEAGMPIYEKAYAYSIAFNIPIEEKMPAPTRFLCEGDVIVFGTHKLRTLYTPGHCEGSICLYEEQNHCLFCGDLIFEGSVGRADLPTGNMTSLIQSIHQKIMTMSDDVTIFPGHGNKTTVGKERTTNPYL